MKLGICVVYVAKEENEKLLDLHLDQIQNNTKVPYKIYASVDQLLPRFRQKLEQNPNIKICKCKPIDSKFCKEHSSYLEQLIKQAIDDGVSHVAIFHVDSFPVRPNWAEYLAGKLSENCVFAAVVFKECNDFKPNSTCIFFSRDFYMKYHPTLYLSDEEFLSKEYKNYKEHSPHIDETGIGYGFKAFNEGLSWHSMLRSNKYEEHYIIASIYDDIVFHLGGGTRRSRKFHGDEAYINDYFKDKVNSIFDKLFFKLFPNKKEEIIIKRYKVYRENIYNKVRAELFKDPEAYLNLLRTGSK